jgi:hypothetical protein
VTQAFRFDPTRSRFLGPPILFAHSPEEPPIGRVLAASIDSQGVITATVRGPLNGPLHRLLAHECPAILPPAGETVAFVGDGKSPGGVRAVEACGRRVEFWPHTPVLFRGDLARGLAFAAIGGLAWIGATFAICWAALQVADALGGR